MKRIRFSIVVKNIGVCYTYPEGELLAYVNHTIKDRENIVNKLFMKTMDELGYDVELTYKKKAAD